MFDSVFMNMVNNKTMYYFCYFLFLADITFLFEKQLTAFNIEECQRFLTLSKGSYVIIYMQDSALQVISAYSHYLQTYALQIMRSTSSNDKQIHIFVSVEYLSS